MVPTRQGAAGRPPPRCPFWWSGPKGTPCASGERSRSLWAPLHERCGSAVFTSAYAAAWACMPCVQPLHAMHAAPARPLHAHATCCNLPRRRAPVPWQGVELESLPQLDASCTCASSAPGLSLDFRCDQARPSGAASALACRDKRQFALRVELGGPDHWHHCTAARRHCCPARRPAPLSRLHVRA